MSRSPILNTPVEVVVAPESSGNLRLAYASDSTLTPTKSASAFDASRASSSSPSPLKRKRSQPTIDITPTSTMASTSSTSPSRSRSPPSLSLPFLQQSDSGFLAVDRDAATPEPPSPVPTEIIEDPSAPPENIDVVEAAKAAGVKVRDFLYEPAPGDARVPEVWHYPQHTLAEHDMYVRTPAVRAEVRRLPGKALHRLLALGWVSQKEAKGLWRVADWAALREYEDRPGGPYPFAVSARHRKPTAAHRRALLKQMCGDLPDLVAEELIYMPPDEPGMDDGVNGEYAAVLPDAHLDKKRRVLEDPVDAPRAPVFTRPPTSGFSISHSGVFSRSISSLLSSSPRSSAGLPASASYPTMFRAPREISRVDVRQEAGTPPPSASPATPPLSLQSSQIDIDAVPARMEPQPATPVRTLGRTQTLLRVQ